MRSRNQLASESTFSCEKVVFFFHYYLATFTCLLFYIYVEIHRVGRLVFDNFQQRQWYFSHFVQTTRVCIHTWCKTRMHIGLCCMLMALKWLPATMCSKKTTIPHYTAFAYDVVIQIQTKSPRKQKIGRLETNTRPVPNNYRFPALCVHTTSSKEGQIPQKEKSHRSKHLD